MPCVQQHSYAMTPGPNDGLQRKPGAYTVVVSEIEAQKIWLMALSLMDFRSETTEVCVEPLSGGLVGKTVWLPET